VNAKFANVTCWQSAEALLDALEGSSPDFPSLLVSEDAILRRDDLIILFNFREDQSFQIAHALIRGLDGAEKWPPNLNVLPMTLCDHSLMDVETLLPPPNHSNSLGGWLAAHGYKQIRMVESYKWPHVTTFFSGGVMQPVFAGEGRAQIKSLPDSVVEFFPEMNASLVTKTAIEGIGSQRYKLVVVNYANIDATGHSGNATAVRIAVQFIDQQISELLTACERNNFALFVTADHGNGEENLLLNSQPQVEHPINNALFLTSVRGFRVKQPVYGQAAFIGNVAATILTVLGMEVPPEMADSLLERVPRGMSPSPRFWPSSWPSRSGARDAGFGPLAEAERESSSNHNVVGHCERNLSDREWNQQTGDPQRLPEIFIIGFQSRFRVNREMVFSLSQYSKSRKYGMSFTVIAVSYRGVEKL
jgi:hypothetical protein